MNKSQEFKVAAWLVGIFEGIYFLPLGAERFDRAALEALVLTKWYAWGHVLLCLLPAFWIAGCVWHFSFGRKT